jgi:hypothetical protein
MKKLLILLGLAGLVYAAWKHYEYHRLEGAEAWASGTDPFE